MEVIAVLTDNFLSAREYLRGLATCNVVREFDSQKGRLVMFYKDQEYIIIDNPIKLTGLKIDRFIGINCENEELYKEAELSVKK